MKLLSLVTILFVLPAWGLSQTVWYVDDDNSSGPWHGSQQYPFQKIQDGIDAASNDEMVLVSPGYYVENIYYLGKAIAVISSKGPGVTMIDGQKLGSVVTFSSGEGPGSILEGFTVKNGNAEIGGGIFCFQSSPTITGNILCGNSADSGGGIICYHGSSPVIYGNTITGNIAEISGGGIACRWGNSVPVITCNTITGNSASCGGGIYYCNSYPAVTNNTIVNNKAVEGGGIYGYGYYEIQPVYITNSILWGNEPRTSEIDIYGIIEPVVTHCNVEGGWPGRGNVDVNPLFNDPGNGDYHLTYGSPCRDAGTKSAPSLPLYDFEGDPRITYGLVDLGADEFSTHLYYQVSNPVPGGDLKVRMTDIPNTGPVVLWVGSGLLDPPLPTSCGDWFLQAPLLCELPIGAVPGQGVLTFTCRLPLDLLFPLDIPIQALMGNKLTNPCSIIME